MASAEESSQEELDLADDIGMTVEASRGERRQTYIFDERVEQPRCVERLDLLTRQQADRNVDAVCALGCVLFLTGEFVVASAQYWLAHYSDPTTKECDWFGEQCRSVVYLTPSLSLVGDEGVPIVVPTGAQPPSLLLRCIGGEQQRVPLQHYQPDVGAVSVHPEEEDDPEEGAVEAVDASWYSQFMVSLGHLLQSRHHAFVQRSDDGLQNEMALGGFVYDALLREFWEPSFVLISMALLHTLATCHSTNAQSTADWLPRHRYAMQSIAYDAWEWERVPQQGEALERLQRDCVALQQAAEGTESGAIIAQLQELWRAKAEWCSVEQERRTKRVYARF